MRFVGKRQTKVEREEEEKTVWFGCSRVGQPYSAEQLRDRTPGITKQFGSTYAENIKTTNEYIIHRQRGREKISEQAADVSIHCHGVSVTNF